MKYDRTVLVKFILGVSKVSMLHPASHSPELDGFWLGKLLRRRRDTFIKNHMSNLVLTGDTKGLDLAVRLVVIYEL